MNCSRSEGHDLGDLFQEFSFMIGRKGHRRANAAADHLDFCPVGGNPPDPDRHAVTKGDLRHVTPARNEPFGPVLLGKRQVIHQCRGHHRFPNRVVAHVVSFSRAVPFQFGNGMWCRTPRCQQCGGCDHHSERKISFHSFPLKQLPKHSSVFRVVQYGRYPKNLQRLFLAGQIPGEASCTIVRLNFQSYGRGFPIIILHGLFGSLDNWQTISRRLGEFFQVFAVDLRNHGGSPHSDDFNYDVMAEDLRGFVETHGLSRCHLLGHSLGGKAAMEFALRHAALVEKLVVVDMAPRAYPPAHIPIFEALLALDLRSFRDRREIADALAPAIPDLVTRQFLLKSLTRDESDALQWRLNLPAIYRNYSRLNQELENGRTFAGPALFLRGQRSDYITEKDASLIRRFFPNAKIVSVSGAGHWIHADAPEAFLKATLDFLR